MNLVDGKEIAASILADISDSMKETPKKLCFISFGDNPASRNYMESKRATAREVGIEAEVVESDASTTEEALKIIESVIADGIVIQLPVRKDLDLDVLLNAVPVEKDIDMLSRSAKELYRTQRTERVPPVARAVQEVLKRAEVDLMGKKVVVLGKGRLVGEPVGMLLDRMLVPYIALDRNTTEGGIIAEIKNADVVISGIGSPNFIKPDMVKDGVVLIDAGTSGEEGRISGDIDPSCADKASLMTPVPGGIGPITVSALFTNLYS